MTATRIDTRGQILAAALDLFAAQGYAGTSLREVADRMGFTKAALYYHFSSKEDLVAELLEPLFSDVEGLLDGAGEVVTAAARRRLLEDYVDVVVTHRRLVGLAFADLSILGRSGLGPRAQDQGRRLAGLLLRDLELGSQVRAAVAIGGLQVAVSALADADAGTVREAACEAAGAALGLPPARRRRAQPAVSEPAQVQP